MMTQKMVHPNNLIEHFFDLYPVEPIFRAQLKIAQVKYQSVALKISR